MWHAAPAAGRWIEATGSGLRIGKSWRGLRLASTDLTVWGSYPSQHLFIQDLKRTKSEVCIFDPLNHALDRWDGVVVVSPRWL